MYEGWSYTLDEIARAKDAGAETSAQAMSASLALVRKLQLARNASLDRACLVALAKGWRPEECRIVHESTLSGGCRDVLEVAGVACFEVVIAFEANWAACSIAVTTTPRMLVPIPWHPRSPLATLDPG